jgi:hypothetical protein
METKIALFRGLGLLVLVTFLGGCAYGSIKPDTVKEYRNFPEYRGYLPIEQPEPAKYNPPRVRADWVLPVIGSDGKADYRLPSTPKEAEQRVKERMERKKVLHPFLALPIGLALSPLFFTVGEYYAHTHPEKLRKEQRAELEGFAGIQVRLSVSDFGGKPLSFARVLELVSPVEVPVFADQESLRRFGIPDLYSYHIPEKMLRLTAEHLPVYIGQHVTIPDALGTNFGGFFGTPDRAFTRQGSAWGRIEYVSLAGGRFAQYKKDEKWVWARSPTPLTMHFIVWAPGFRPKIHTINNVYPKNVVSLTVSLERLPTGDEIEKAYGDYLGVFEVIPRVVRRSFWTEWDVEEQGFKVLTEKLERFAGDETLPGFIRYNAGYLLQNIRAHSWTWNKKNLTEELGGVVARTREKTKSVTPYLSDGPDNPWQIRERYERLIYKRGIKVDPGGIREFYAEKVFEATPEVAQEIEDIISSVERISPDSPELETLCALRALAKGDRSTAFPYTRNLGHREFFNLFYGMTVAEPGE